MLQQFYNDWNADRREILVHLVNADGTPKTDGAGLNIKIRQGGTTGNSTGVLVNEVNNRGINRLAFGATELLIGRTKAYYEITGLLAWVEEILVTPCPDIWEGLISGGGAQFFDLVGTTPAAPAKIDLGTLPQIVS